MENNTKQQISTPVAIIVAGVLIMIGILLTNGVGSKTSAPKTLSEQVGVSKDKFDACIKDTDVNALNTSISSSVSSAMKSVPDNQRGTPYSVVVGKNGVKMDVQGADSFENLKKTIDEVAAGKASVPYTGEVPPVSSADHIYGNPDAAVTVIEYSDFECPYCKIFQSTLKKTVDESNGNVNWVYRHWPIHQNSVEKLIAAECIAKLKGNDAFWKYSDLLFGMLKTAADPISNQL